MNSRNGVFALGGALLLGMVGVTHAETPAANDLQAKVAALEAQVNELKSQKSDTWLNEKRAEEVKSLVKEVLSDADTRASLADTGLTAGHNGKNFFLASEDGNFLMNISGTLQVRYTWDHRHHPTSDTPALDENGDPILDDDENPVFLEGDANENGFTLNRAKVRFEGHVVNPSWLYKLQLATDRDSGSVFAEVATIGYKAMDNVTITAGRFKAPFLREDNVDDEYQLAVDRSLATTVFSAGYIEGVVANIDATDMIKVALTIDDGNRSGNQGVGKDFMNDSTDIALGGRIDVKLAGDWKQANDFSAWEGEETGIFIGAAVRWDLAETGDTGENGKTLRWTVDAALEMAGLNVSGAFIGSVFSGDDADSVPHDIDAYGAEVQAGYMVIPDKLEPFVRFDWVFVNDDAAASPQREVKTITVGANYYVAKHAAKFTVDVIWALDPVTGLIANSGDIAELGLQPDATDNQDQVAVRAQLQLLF